MTDHSHAGQSASRPAAHASDDTAAGAFETITDDDLVAGTDDAFGRFTPAADRADAPATVPIRRRSSARPPGQRTLLEKCEAFVSRLSTRNNFWHRVCSMIWLPYAFRSGIRMLDKRSGEGQGDAPFEAMLPFRPFNKNWYNAMAGASLLGASEVAGGMAIFKHVGSDYRVVCKELEYRFLRPCVGPAVYRVEPEDDLDALLETGNAFNIRVKINIYQGLTAPGEREKRVGRSFATFHVSPKADHAAKAARNAKPARAPDTAP